MDLIRKEAYNIILKVLKNHVHSDRLLDQAFKKIEDDQDKNFLNHLVRGTIKMKGNLEYIAASLSDKEKYAKTDLKIKVLLYLGLFQLKYCNSVPEHSAVDETVELAKQLLNPKVADYVNALLRNYLRNPKIEYPSNPVERMAAEHSFPSELIESWIEDYGEDETELLCLYFNENPKLSIRVNRIATDFGKVKKYMDKKGYELSASECSDHIFTTTFNQAVLNDVSFEEGYFSIQDGSAAMVVELLDPQMDDYILDLFAGPGGKCTYISEIIENTGEVIAVDKFPQKTKLIKSAIHRLQITNMKIITEDAFKYGPKVAAYDRVLLDVPCSGWGVLQKKAELRWQHNQDMKSLIKLQENALTTGAQFVKVGGILVYSTCTINRQENEEQIEKFLQKNGEFELVDAGSSIPSKYVSNGVLRTLPHRHMIDGAFAAKMVKRGK
ncbi:MAG: 16S rRNA (cytosine(967)-C(5))-methyltransferase RsmB [Candidatus Cloacimonas sp.]|nr:16S rRNA (cytosine(967)-C(5))-methyltransferase RsmB [Candidatus Cloacimonadota bacterium]